MEKETEIQNIQPEEQEIDLVELFQKLWGARKFILKWALIGMVVGVVVAFSIPKQYSTHVTMAPELQSNRPTGGLSSLAAMAGINLKSASMTEALNPMLYPDILSSVPFNVELFDVEVKTSGKDSKVMPLRQYLEEEMSSPWWSVVISLPFKALGTVVQTIKGDDEDEGDNDPNHKPNPFRLTKKEAELIKTMNTLIGSDVDNTSGVISVNVTMQDPLVAAMVADTVVERLKVYVTNYRTDKARKDMEYAQKICDEARDDYDKAQRKYAQYADRNQGISSLSGRIQLERLQNEANLAYDVYTTSAQQLQMAKAKVQEMAPVYTVLEPSTVPTKPSKPSKIMILIGMIFLACVGAAAWVLYGKDFMASFKKKAATDPKSAAESEE